MKVRLSLVAMKHRHLRKLGFIGTTYPGKFFVDSISEYAMDANNDILTYEKVDGPEWIKVSSSGTIFGTPEIKSG